MKNELKLMELVEHVERKGGLTREAKMGVNMILGVLATLFSLVPFLGLLVGAACLYLVVRHWIGPEKSTE